MGEQKTAFTAGKIILGTVDYIWTSELAKSTQESQAILGEAKAGAAGKSTEEGVLPEGTHPERERGGRGRDLRVTPRRTRL